LISQSEKAVGCGALYAVHPNIAIGQNLDLILRLRNQGYPIDWLAPFSLRAPFCALFDYTSKKMYTMGMSKRSWNIIYYEKVDGHSPVYDFLEALSEKEKAKAFNWIAMLEQQGPQLPRPYADILEDGIHELRIKLTGDQVRVLYFFCYRDFIILTHCFVKTSDKVQPAEIVKAKRYREDFLNRYTEKTIRRVINEDL
jgi:phage-related protein